MSIANEISRISAAKSALKAAINAKGGTLTTELLDDYAAAVTALSVSSGEGETLDLSFVTAMANDILAGKVGSDQEGNPVNGTIPTVTASKSGNVVSVPKGYIATAQTLTIDAAQSATVSGNVVTIYPGYTANQYTAIIPKAASSVSGNVVTIPAGYHDATTKTVAEMSEPSVSANVVTIPVGYNKTEKGVTIPEAEILYGRSEGGNVTKHSLSISAGYVPEEKSWTFRETDLNGINATADKMLSGTVSLDASGEKITGNIPTVTATAVNNVVTVPVGYIAEQQTFQISGEGSVTPPAAGTMEFYKCAAVYGPHNVDCYIVTGCPDEAVNGTYMPTENTTQDFEGNPQTVYANGKGYYYYYEPNMWMDWGISANYTGDLEYSGSVGGSWSDTTDWMTVEGMSCLDSKVEVDTDVPKTWDGYKAVQSGGVYTFEKTLTTGLTYGSAYQPIIDKLYSPDASLCFQGIKMAIPDDPLIYLSLSGEANTAETGQALTYPGELKKYTFSEIIDGIPCITFLSSSGIIVAQPLPLDGDFTISSWCRANTYGGVASIWKIGTESKNEMRLGTRDNGNLIIETYSSDGQRSEISNVGKQFSWFHIVVKKQSNIVSAYLDGYFVGSVEWNITLIDDGTCHVGYPHGSSGLGASPRSQAAFRFYARALSDDEIFALAYEFVPKK